MVKVILGFVGGTTFEFNAHPDTEYIALVEECSRFINGAENWNRLSFGGLVPNRDHLLYLKVER